MYALLKIHILMIIIFPNANQESSHYCWRKFSVTDHVFKGVAVRTTLGCRIYLSHGWNSELPFSCYPICPCIYPLPI